MISHSAEIDGYAFCLGLSRLGFVSDDADIPGWVRSTIHVIRGAYSDGPSRNTHSLGELVNMYHSHKATDRRDKIYALLGMKSDDGGAWDLSADYEIPWEDLFYRVVRYLVNSEASVATWSEEEVAMINANGVAFGKVLSVSSTGNWGDQQVLEIRLNPMIGSYQSKNWIFGQRVSWTLPNTAKPIQKDDIVWVLQGSPNAAFIRLYEDHAEVIAIGVDPPDDNLTQQPFEELLGHLQSTPIPFYSLPLIWDWKINGEEHNHKTDYAGFLQSRDPERADINFEEPPDKAARLHSVGLVLRELGEGERAAAALETAVSAYGVISREMYSQMREVVDSSDPSEGPMLIASVFGREKDGLDITEENIASIAKSCDQELMRLLLDHKGDEIQITENILQAAASNARHGVKVIKTLLELKGNAITMTESVLDKVATNKSNGIEMMKHLLALPKHQIPINESVLKTAVSNNRWPADITKLLFDQQADRITLTEDVLKAAVSNPTSAKEMTGLLLTRRGSEGLITDSVLQAAVKNRRNSDALEYLLDQRESQINPNNPNTNPTPNPITISEALLKTALSNPFSASTMLTVLTTHSSASTPISITEPVLKAAVSNPGDPCRAVSLLFDLPRSRTKSRIVITEGVVKAAVSNRFKAEEVTRLLFERRGSEVPVTEDVVKTAVMHPRQAEKLLALFFDRRGSGGGSGCGSGSRIVITDEVLRTVESREKDRYRLFKLIGERSGIPVDHFLCKYRDLE